MRMDLLGEGARLGREDHMENKSLVAPHER
ncbi:hypothetical protein BN978_01869 [Mycolicibacterium mageritense DSM 44476 = CIP 104973]|nr:hypothetical protein BN978_01869 [Mycolicibacterium mageritense DSM 44476 = CIP 104973]